MKIPKLFLTDKEIGFKKLYYLRVNDGKGLILRNNLVGVASIQDGLLYLKAGNYWMYSRRGCFYVDYPHWGRQVYNYAGYYRLSDHCFCGNSFINETGYTRVIMPQ